MELRQIISIGVVAGAYLGSLCIVIAAKRKQKKLREEIEVIIEMNSILNQMNSLMGTAIKAEDEAARTERIKEKLAKMNLEEIPDEWNVSKIAEKCDIDIDELAKH